MSSILKGEIQKENAGRFEDVFDPSFIQAMAEGSMRGSLHRTVKEVSTLQEFQKARKLLDLGGGHGLYAIAFSQINPNLEAVLFDLPHVTEVAKEFITKYEMEERIAVIGGNFLEDDIGNGYDIIFVSDVFYRKKDVLIDILKKIHGALNDNGSIVLKHWLLNDDRTAPLVSVLFDLKLSVRGDRHYIYTEDEYIELLQEVGFSSIRVLDISSSSSPSVLIIGKREVREVMIEDIDWNGMWKELMQNASWSRRRRGGDMTDFWDKRAKHYNESIKRHNHAERIIAKLEIDPECTVLDIGAGPGTLAMPLARMVKHVTAIDPSSGMLECLKENAVSEGLKNISCINRRWEDVALGTDIAEHDIVLASHSLAMLDIKEALSKMNDAAKRCVYIFTFAGARMWDYNTLWPKIYGEEYQPGPDYIYLYNVLYGMGIHANIEITNSEYKQRFSNLDEAVAQWKENLDVLTPETEEVIRPHLSENLIEEDGALWSKREMRSAMIWWRKEEVKV